jgi:hypothetical protein
MLTPNCAIRFLAKAILIGDPLSGIPEGEHVRSKQREALGSDKGLGQPIVTKFLKGGGEVCDEGSESE